MSRKLQSAAVVCLSALLALAVSGCDGSSRSDRPAAASASDEAFVKKPPVPPVVVRQGHTVRIELTAQTTSVEISEDEYYAAWTFNGTVPGPVLRVKESDTIHLVLKNIDPSMQHSVDLHAVHAAPSKKFIDVMPNEEGEFTYMADTPGVFMYHCGTQPVLLHIGNGMYGMIIVEPKDGYPGDASVDREYTLVQSEWYKENDYDAMLGEAPEYVVFNGSDFALSKHPLLAKPGERIRLYVVNAGPNEVSSFHVVGTILDRVFADGNPANVQRGLQTALIPAGGGAVVEFTVLEEGDYPIVTHQFKDAAKGAVAVLRVTKDGTDHGGMPMGH